MKNQNIAPNYASTVKMMSEYLKAEEDNLVETRNRIDRAKEIVEFIIRNKYTLSEIEIATLFCLWPIYEEDSPREILKRHC